MALYPDQSPRGHERELSRGASVYLGFEVKVMFVEGAAWCCDPLGEESVGFGSTSADAVHDCFNRNRPVPPLCDSQLAKIDREAA